MKLLYSLNCSLNHSIERSTAMNTTELRNQIAAITSNLQTIASFRLGKKQTDAMSSTLNQLEALILMIDKQEKQADTELDIEETEHTGYPQIDQYINLSEPMFRQIKLEIDQDHIENVNCPHFVRVLGYLSLWAVHSERYNHLTIYSSKGGELTAIYRQDAFEGPATYVIGAIRDSSSGEYSTHS